MMFFQVQFFVQTFTKAWRCSAAIAFQTLCVQSGRVTSFLFIPTYLYPVDNLLHFQMSLNSKIFLNFNYRLSIMFTYPSVAISSYSPTIAVEVTIRDFNDMCIRDGKSCHYYNYWQQQLLEVDMSRLLILF